MKQNTENNSFITACLLPFSDQPYQEKKKKQTENLYYHAHKKDKSSETGVGWLNSRLRESWVVTKIPVMGYRLISSTIQPSFHLPW